MTEGKMILVADDEVELTELLQIRLEALGYRVDIARDGQETLEKVNARKPDLILLDVMMPKLNGFQVCRELKNKPETRTIPILLLTAKSQESDRFWGKETGADEYITKPFDKNELISKIQLLLEKHLPENPLPKRGRGPA